MPPVETQSKAIGWLVAAAAAAIFVLDILTPLGHAVSMLYVLPILLTWFAPSWRSTVFVTGGVFILTWVRAVVSHDEISSAVLTHRVLVSFLLIVVAWLLLKQKHLAQQRAADQSTLRESEERFAKAFRASPHPIGITEVATGRCIEVNEACLQLFGFCREEVIGNTTLMLGIWPNHEDRARLIERLKAGEPVRNLEASFRTRSGDLRQILVSSDLVELSGTLCLITVGNDITDRKRAEVALRRAELRYRNIFEQVGTGMAQVNSHTGQFERVNRKYCEIVGLTEEEMLATTFMSLTHPEDLAKNLAFLERLRNGEIPAFTMEKRYVRKDSSIVWVNLNVVPLWEPGESPAYHIAAVQDITARKEAEQLLCESEARFRALIQASSDVVYRMSPDWAELRYLVGRDFIPDTDRPSGTWLQKYIHPDDRVHVMAAINEAIRTKRAFELEYRVLRVDGTFGWTFSRAIPILDTAGEVNEWFGMASDVTARRQAEEQARRAAADLAEAQRIAKLGSWRFDVESDRIILSDQLCTMFEVKPSPLGETYESFLALIHQDDRPGVVQANVEARAHGSPFDLEFRIVTRDGLVKTMRELGYAQRNAADRIVGLFGTVQDITERKRVETALRESEERLLLALESANMGTWEWDAVTDSLLCNYWQFLLFGVRAEAGPNTGTEALSRIHADDRARVTAAVHRVREEGVTVGEEFRVVHADGSVHWLFGSGRPAQDERGRCRHVVGVCLDITERRQNQESMQSLNEILETRVRERTAQLVEANERWDWVVRATNDGIWDWDLVSDTAYFSPRWKEMHGFHERDVPESTKEWRTRIHPDDRSFVLASLEGYLSGKKGDYWKEEYRIRRKNGAYFWVLDRGIAIFNDKRQAVRMVGADTDITWRKEVEEALRFREQQFHMLADNVPALFAYVDRDRRYRFVNKQYEQLFGRSDEEITRMSVRDLKGPESYAEVQPYLEKALAGEPLSFEYEVNVPGAGVHVLSARYVPDRGAQGEVIGLFALSTDITTMKASERLLREREEQLRELGVRLLQAQEEERRRISRDLHDDVMQRMGALALELHGLASATSSQDAEWQAQLKSFGASAEQLTTDLQRMAHQLHPSVLEFAGLEAAVREQVNEFAERTGLSAELITRNVPPDISLDQATCLFRIVQEGLQNVQKHAEATTVLIRLLRTGKGLGLCIHDDGRGIENIDGAARRKGLGLTSMAERVGMLKGIFHVRTKPGDGTELHAWVPLEDVKRET